MPADSDGRDGTSQARWFDAIFADPDAFVGLLDTDGGSTAVTLTLPALPTP